MTILHRKQNTWQPPPGYQPIESAVAGITVYAPIPETTSVYDEKRFTCPQCGATTHFDVRAGGVACEYCGYVATPHAEKVGRRASEHEFTLTTMLKAEQGWGLSRRELHCESCGADLAVTEEAISSTCAFCGSNRVNLRATDAEQLRPRYLAPFIIQPDTVRARVRDWLGRGWMHPRQLAHSASITRMPGIYLPFWTFDSVITSAWRAEVGYPKKERYYSISSKAWKTRTKIEWRWEEGHVVTDIDDLLISGSSHLNPHILERLYPFNLHELVAYSPDYLAGWQAHAYDITLPDAWETGKATMRQQARDDCYQSIQTRSSHIRNFSMTADFADEVWRYILLPIYLSSYTYEGNVYQVMVQGQSGVVAGQKPVDWRKVWLAMSALVLPGMLLIMIDMVPALITGGQASPLLLLGVVLLILGTVFAVGMHQRAVHLEKVA